MTRKNLTIGGRPKADRKEPSLGYSTCSAAEVAAMTRLLAGFCDPAGAVFASRGAVAALSYTWRSPDFRRQAGPDGSCATHQPTAMPDFSGGMDHGESGSVRPSERPRFCWTATPSSPSRWGQGNIGRGFSPGCLYLFTQAWGSRGPGQATDRERGKD